MIHYGDASKSVKIGPGRDNLMAGLTDILDQFGLDQASLMELVQNLGSETISQGDGSFAQPSHKSVFAQLMEVVPLFSSKDESLGKKVLTKTILKLRKFNKMRELVKVQPEPLRRDATFLSLLVDPNITPEMFGQILRESDPQSAPAGIRKFWESFSWY